MVPHTYWRSAGRKRFITPLRYLPASEKFRPSHFGGPPPRRRDRHRANPGTRIPHDAAVFLSEESRAMAATRETDRVVLREFAREALDALKKKSASPPGSTPTTRWWSRESSTSRSV